MPKVQRHHYLFATALAIAVIATLPWVREAWRRSAGGAGAPASPPPPMPDLSTLHTWVQGGPPDPGHRQARVVAVFSATDPAALDLLPAAQAWSDAYRARGVDVVGLHRPQFSFGADTTLLANALARLAVRFPVAQDAALETPLSGGLPSTCLLVGDARGGVAVVAIDAASLAAADAWLRARIAHTRFEPPHASERVAPRTFGRLLRLGAGQVSAGPLAGTTPGVGVTFITQTRHEEEGRPWVPVPVGRWTPAGDGLVADRGGAANFVSIQYDAARVGVIASPPEGAPARLWVLRDDAWVTGDRRGRDLEVDASGATYVEISEPRLVIVIERDDGRHVLKLSPEAPGTTLHALAFDPPAPGAGPP